MITHDGKPVFDQYDHQAINMLEPYIERFTQRLGVPDGLEIPLELSTKIAAALRQAAQAERERCLGVVDWFIEAADRGRRSSQDADTYRVIGYHREAYEMVRDRLLDTSGKIEE